MKNNFYLSKNKDGSALIVLKSWYLPKSLPFVYSTKMNVPQTRWNAKTHRLKHTRDYPEAIELNALLNAIQQAFVSCYALHRAQSLEMPSHTQLRELMNARLNNKKQMNLIEFATELSESRAKQPEKYGAGTISKYKKCIKKIRIYGKDKRKSFSFNDIDRTWLEGFQRHLYDSGLARNSVAEVWAKLKVFLTQAEKQKLYQLNAHKDTNLAITYERADATFLSEHELMDMYELKLENDMDVIIRDLFLLDALSGGFRFGDLKNISHSNTIKLGDIDCIKIYTRKTSEMVYIPANWFFYEFVEKYSNNFPTLPSEKHFNFRIKKIAKAAGITEQIELRKNVGGRPVYVQLDKYESISQYTARYSFATNLYLNEVDIKTISTILGHKKIETTMGYIKAKQIHTANMLHKNKGFTQKPTRLRKVN